jgi:hypothetical protein
MSRIYSGPAAQQAVAGSGGQVAAHRTDARPCIVEVRPIVGEVAG